MIRDYFWLSGVRSVCADVEERSVEGRPAGLMITS
jgi:hypothetical protein